MKALSLQQQCSIEEFAVYFLNFLRNQTEEYIRGTASQSNTPRKISICTPQQPVSQSNQNVSRQLFTPSDSTPARSSHNTTREFSESELYDKKFPTLSSTPIRSFNQPKTPSTTKSSANVSLSSTISKSNDKSRKSVGSPLCFDDFFNTPTTSKTKPRKYSKSFQQNDSSLNLSDADFPAIGQQKSKSSVRSTFSQTPKETDTGQQKPRKRVAPITVISHSNQNEFSNPSVRTENNLLNLGQEETPISRNLLKTHIDAISKDFENENYPRRSIRGILQLDKRFTSQSNTISMKIDLKNVTHVGILSRLMDIHSAIIDLHLTTNILTELSYLLNLFNVEGESFVSSVAPVTATAHITDAAVTTTTATISTSTRAIDILTTANDEAATSSDFVEPHLINCQTSAVASVSTVTDTQAFTPISLPNPITSTPTSTTTTTAITTKLRTSTIYAENIFKNINNCVFYSLGVLSKQKHVLALLDCTTMKVLLENERLLEFHDGIKDFLLLAYSHKLKLESIGRTQEDTSFNVDGSSISGSVSGGGGGGSSGGGPMNVFYQQEMDTKDNFPSMREFMIFRKQRDLFCNIFRLWETRHLNPSWIFEAELGSKVRSLIALSDHPVNMAHLAKLFTSQLILCCNYDAATQDLQMALPAADINKLSKLQQRLIAPSSFCTEDLYPGNQLFFKDFLMVANLSCIFFEQLKMAFVAELMEKNCSSFEILNLTVSAGDDNWEEYIVRPATLAIMKVLAKFLGLIMSKPYAFDGPRSQTVDDRQIELRNMLKLQFDIKSILTDAISNRKLLITIPWLVQYIAMMDYITLRVDYFTDVLNILFELYVCLCERYLTFKIRPTSVLILKTCLGWLFERSNIPDAYYKYRQNRSNTNNLLNLNSALLKSQVSEKMVVAAKQDSNILLTMDPMLEQYMNSACPFLADFRMSIMPIKHSKSVSRTGRFRHITTRLAETPNAIRSIECDPQTKLTEVFLRSQSLSVRRTVEFITERTVSAVIKDFQMETMIPLKQKTIEKNNQIQSMDKKILFETMHEHYTDSMIELIRQWDQIIPGMIVSRATKAFDALLPNETLAAVKMTCISISVNRCKQKAQEWRTSNLNKLDFFSKDIAADVDKFLQNKLIRKPSKSLEFQINLTKILPAEIFSNLQKELHCCSLRPHELSFDEVNDLVINLKECLMVQTLPSAMCKTIAFMTLQFLKLLICNRHDLVSNNLIEQFINLWKCKCLWDFTKPINDDDADDGCNDDFDKRNISHEAMDDSQRTTKIINDPCIFNHLISSCYLEQLASCQDESFKALQRCLVQLIKNDFMTVSHLNTQCIEILRYEWPTELLNRLSKLLCDVLDDIAAKSEIKNDLLFLEMISDLSRDMDLF